MRIISLAALIFVISGCGIAHLSAKVPPLEIIAKIINSENEQTKTVHIVVPQFYGGADAFLTMVRGNFTESVSYQWKKRNLSPDGVITANFKEEERYIGLMPPFSPSKKTRAIREIFIWVEGSQAYRIIIYGKEVSAETTDIYSLRKSLPASLQNEPQGPRDDSQRHRIEQVIQWYDKINWRKAAEFRLVEIARSPELDKLSFELKIN